MNRVLSTKTFIFSQILILIIGITILLIINYKLNIEGQTNKLYSPTGGPITAAPTTLTLSITSPDENLLSFEPRIIISGQTSPNLVVLIFNDTQNLVIKSKPDGNFSTSLYLDEGVNNITIAVFSPIGEQKTQSRTVYFSKEKI